MEIFRLFRGQLVGAMIQKVIFFREPEDAIATAAYVEAATMAAAREEIREVYPNACFCESSTKGSSDKLDN